MTKRTLHLGWSLALLTATSGCELIDDFHDDVAWPDGDGDDDGPPPPVGCEAVLCLEGTYCDDISGQAECLPLPSCDGVECEPGGVCRLVDVQCVRHPCPPQPSCVPTDGVRCGPNTCAADEVCCNESCGICTPPDGFCTEQFCGAEN